jgi:hypothetical protein
VSLEVDLDGEGARGAAMPSSRLHSCGAEAAGREQRRRRGLPVAIRSRPGAHHLRAANWLNRRQLPVARDLRHAAAEVIEVGTTNRTYAADYERVAKRATC